MSIKRKSLKTMQNGESYEFKISIIPWLTPYYGYTKRTRASRATGAKGYNLFASNSRLWYHVKRIKYQ